MSQKIVRSYLTKNSMEADPFRTGGQGTIRVQAEFASESGRRGAEIAGLGTGAVTTSIVNATVARRRSRYAILTNGYAKRAIDILVSNYVGDGTRMISQAPDKGLKKEIEELWGEWSEAVDSSGALSLNGFEALAFRSMIEGGDCFVRLRTRRMEDGLPVPLQLQLFEAEQVPVLKNEVAGTRKIIGGIEFDPVGRVFAYHMFKNHPSDAMFRGIGDLETLVVPASEILHLHDVRRPNEVRGLPVLASALIQLSDLDKYLDAELVRKKASALIGGFIRRPHGDDSGNPFRAIGDEDDDSEVQIEALEPGTFPILPPGYDVSFTAPTEVGGSFQVFMKSQLMQIAASINILYEQLTGDASDVNDRTIRATLIEFKRIATSYQKNIIHHQFYRKVWKRWFDLAIISGQLKIPQSISEKEARRVTWVADPWDFFNPQQEVATNILEVRAGFKSRSEIITARGGVPEDVDFAVQSDQARERELGITFDTNVLEVSKAGQFQSETNSENIKKETDNGKN